MYFQHSTKHLSLSGQNSVEQAAKDFPERLQLAIEQTGGAEKLANKVGVSLLILQSWCSGKTEPSRSNLIKIAQVSQLSLHWLVSGQERVDERPDLCQNPSGADLDSLEEILLRIRRLFIQQNVNLLPRAHAHVVRLAYEFYLHQGHHMDDASVDNLMKKLVI